MKLKQLIKSAFNQNRWALAAQSAFVTIVAAAGFIACGRGQSDEVANQIAAGMCAGIMVSWGLLFIWTVFGIIKKRGG